MPWYHLDLIDFDRRRPGGYGPPTAAEEALRAEVDTCAHDRAARVGKTDSRHCRDCGSTYIPDAPMAAGPEPRAADSSPGDRGTSGAHLDGPHRLEEEQQPRPAEQDEGGVLAAPGEKAIVDAEPSITKTPEPDR